MQIPPAPQHHIIPVATPQKEGAQPWGGETHRSALSAHSAGEQRGHFLATGSKKASQKEEQEIVAVGCRAATVQHHPLPHISPEPRVASAPNAAVIK